MTALWHWLEAHNLVNDLIGTAVAILGAHVATWLPLRAHRKRQDQIADLLSTDTPGGLADVVKAVKPTVRGKP